MAAAEQNDERPAGSQEPPGAAGADRPEAGFAGARVASFESRQQAAMDQLIRKHGGWPWVSPSMQELPEVDAQAPALQGFAQSLLDGSLDTVIAMTGVGFKYLMDVLSGRHRRQQLVDFLTDITTIARGPKPTAAMHQMGVTATHKVPPPHTWREILTLVDGLGLAANRQIAVLEYGETNASLIAGLEARGAAVMPVTIYRWGLPADLQPLEANIRRLVAGQLDVALFTSAQQVVHLLQVAERMGCRGAVIGALHDMVIGSIGPTTSERLREFGLPVTVEPDHGKMARLVSATAQYWQAHRPLSGAVPDRPAEPGSSPAPPSCSTTATHSTPVAHSKAAALPTAPPVMLMAGQLEDRAATEAVAASFAQHAWYDGPFLRACRREPTAVTPVWLMRQAGRYMAEYREVRAPLSFLELCKSPALCSEVMCTAVAKLKVDAAIIFSDLLPILEPMGFELSFGPGHGPKIHNPVRQAADVERVRPLSGMAELEFVVETVRLTRRDLPHHLPVIGFAGAPFTLASYCIEGGGSRSFVATKRLMYADPGAWHELMARLTDSVILYLNAQVRAGAGCLQIFDSWVGALSPADYEVYVWPHVCRLHQGLARNVPTIHFGTGNPQLLPYYAAAGPAVVGVDWRIELDEAWRMIGDGFAVQGNLDPLVLLGPQSTIRGQVQRILGQANQRPGHIFNLGHGIVPETPVENVVALVEMVHELSQRQPRG
jgi:uroporphyrinogen decarboxylase